MFDRTSAGWNLSKQSWQVLKLDKELILFPLLSGIACLLVTASFAVPVLALVEVDRPTSQTATADGSQTSPTDVLTFLGALAYYVANYFVIIFFNSALIACALIRFKGGNPTLRDGFSAAFARLPQIFCWALVAGTVGMLLRMLQSNTENRLSRFLVSLLGVAWSSATYFVVPVIVVEKLGPLAAGRRSLDILRSTWGESLGARFGIGCIVALMMLVSFVPVIVGVVCWGIGQPVVGIPLVLAGLGMLMSVVLISSALESIILAALYLYAAEGRIPDQFQGDAIQSAF
ncbi:MAG: hypothetical protein CMJ70_05535 [Planctomycetaceae bacterium]|nr:hypothetical protein [Planctomycetaceae bacterium]